MRDEFFAHFGWGCSHTVQTVVAHIKEPLSWSPHRAKLTEKTPRRIKGEQAPPEDCPMTTRTRENELREVPLWRACDSGSSGVVDMSTATRRTLSCACAVKGNAAAARYTYMSAGRGDRRSTFWEPPMPTPADRKASPAGNHCSYCAAGAPHCFVKINA